MRKQSKRIGTSALLVFAMVVTMVGGSLASAAAAPATSTAKRAVTADATGSVRASAIATQLASPLDVMKALATGDNNIPGVVLPASPVKGTLSKVTPVDYEDVYAVHLGAGEQITFVMTGATGTDFDLYLYAPSATDVRVNTGLIASSATPGTSSEAFSFTAASAGTYYLDVSQYSGSGAYTLYWDKDPAAGNDIPGVALPASPFTRTLDMDEDYDDVYAVPLTAGDTLSLSMSGSANTNFDLYLFPPDAASVGVETSAVASSKKDTYPEVLSYTVPTTGTYYLDVYAVEGLGGIGTYTVTRWSTLTNAVAPSSVYRTMPLSVTGFIESTYTAGSSPVRIYTYLKVGTAYSYKGYVNAKATNYVSGTSTLSKYTANMPLSSVGVWLLRAYHPADATRPAAWSSGYTAVTVKDVYVKTPVAPSTMYKTKTYTVYGTLQPRHTAGTYPVRIYKYRYVGGHWVYYGYVKAKASNYSSYTKYAASVRLQYTGKWKIKAYSIADSLHPAKSSAWKYITVK